MSDAANDSFCMVYVTVPDSELGESLARGALEAALVACVNILPGIESHFWWEGHIEMSAEVLLILKTTRNKISALEEFILSHHPYEVPEFIVIDISSGNRRYLDWIARSVNHL